MTRPRILVVEAGIQAEKELNSILRGLGYPITSVVHSGREAIRRIPEEKPDLVIVDTVPNGESDGVTVAEEIRSVTGTPAVFSVDREAEREIRGLRAVPPFGYVLKPCSERELEVVVECALHHSRVSTERKREADLLRRREEFLDALHDTYLGMLKRLSPDDLLKSIVVRACALLGCDHGYIYLYDPETGALEIKAASNPLDGISLGGIKPGHGLAGKVFETGTPLCVDNYVDWEERLPDVAYDRMRAIVGAPLKSEANVHGVITVAHCREGVCFGREEIDLLSRFAELAAVTLEHALLYETLGRELEERTRAEEALAESEAKYRLLVEGSGDVVYALGPDYRFTYLSPVVERLTGYTPEEIKNLDMDEFFTPDSADILRKAYRRRIRDEKVGIRKDDVERWELEHKHKNGHTIWGEVSVKPVRHSNGRFAGLQGVTRDITARKKAETALRESEEKYRLVAYATADIIFEFYFSDGLYAHISPNCREILGYTDEELSSASWFVRDRMVPPEDLPELKKIYAAGLKGPRDHIVYEFRVRCKDGRIKYLQESSIFIRHADGRVAGMIGSYKDITDKKRMETQLRQAQKMEAIGTLAGGIAHDFNNILGAILGFTELAMMDLSADHPARDKLVQVERSGNRAKSLVQQILSFSRRTDQERKPLHLGPILKESLKLLRASLPSTIEIRQQLDTNAGMVMADSTQIHQLIMNLCTNAAHAMQKGGGTLEARLDRVILDEEAARQYAELGPGRYRRISISDTGTGMDMETMDRVFEPFFTTKRAGEGTGMGLAVVHGIVKSHDGAITVYSEPGRGSTFRVYLPEILDEAEDEPSPNIGILPTGWERILLVDDEENLVTVGGRILERLGYRVTGLTSAVDALKLFREVPDKFDLVITDQTMPYMTGIRLAEELMRIRPEIPIILCTGFSHETTAEEALALGIKRFLMKPMNAGEIGRTVREVLDNG